MFFFYDCLDIYTALTHRFAPGTFIRPPDSPDSSDDEKNGKFKLSLPKLPKMPEKPNAQERLVEWGKYKLAIECYFGLMRSKVTASQKMKLLYLGGGSEIQKSLEHFKSPESGDEAKDFDTMIKHMDHYFKTGVDTLAYLMQLFSMKQKDTEQFADFAQRLKAQADLCELGEAKENLLKTQIQKGARNSKIFASAEAWLNKSLDDVIALGIADEANANLTTGTKRKQDQPTTSDDESVNRVTGPPNSKYRKFTQRRANTLGKRQNDNNSGYRQTQTKIGAQKSQAYPYSSGQKSQTGSGASHIRCFNCKRMGHYARDCRSNIFAVYGNQKVEDEIFE